MTVNIYLIESIPSPLFDRAFRALSSFNNTTVTKINESVVINNFQTLKPNSQFVLTDFKCATFEFLESMKIRSIFSAHAICDCIARGSALPDTKSPIFCRILSNRLISTSKLAIAEKRSLYKSIAMMGGASSDDLTRRVTILLTNRVDSEKYRMANSIGTISILKPDWIDAIWTLSSQKIDFDPFSRSLIDQYRVPIFNRLVIDLVGFEGVEERRLCRLVEENGGAIGRRPNDPATIFVMKSNGDLSDVGGSDRSRIVSVDWVKESVARGSCLEWSQYRLWPVNGNDDDHNGSDNNNRLRETIIIDTKARKDAVFHGRRFFLDSSLSENRSAELIERITANGGEILDRLSDSIDYIVAASVLQRPIKLDRRSTKLVTSFYIDQSIDRRQLLDIEEDYLFCPSVIGQSLKDLLRGCHLWFVGEMEEDEETELELLAVAVGATVWSGDNDLAQKTPCTHMLTRRPISQNFEIRSGTVAVDAVWLHRCVSERSRLSEKPFLITHMTRTVTVAAADNQALTVANSTNNPGDTTGNQPQIDNKADLKNYRDQFVTAVSGSSSGRKKRLAHNYNNNDNAQLEMRIPSAKISLMECDNSEKRDVAWNYEDSNDLFPMTEEEKEIRCAASKIANESSSSHSKPHHTSVSISPIVTKITRNTKLFAFSGINDAEKSRLEFIIHKLGGLSIRCSMLTDKVTHLISGEPNCVNKYMEAMASGKWILHWSYIDASNRNDAWVDEEPYEWGSQETMALLPTTKQDYARSKELAVAARKWRKKNGFAFYKWKILLIDDKDKIDRIKHILICGGAEILSTGETYPPTTTITHAFLRSNYFNIPNPPLPLDYKWIKIDYIVAYLIAQSIDEAECIKDLYYFKQEDIVKINNN